MKEPPGVTVETANPGDANDIARVIRASYSRHSASHIPYDMPIYHGEHHSSAMEDSATRWLVLRENGLVMGVAMWRILPGMAHLHLLFVDSECQGKGYGSILLKHHHDGAKQEHKDTRLFTLHCLHDSLWATRFYKGRGYTVYQPGDEKHVLNLYIWIDACKRHDNGWPLGPEKALLYKIDH